MDLLVEEPATEGMDVYISLVVASPFGQSATAHASSLGIRVNGGDVSGDPIETSSGEFVRLTWTWRANNEGAHNITIEAIIQLQAGTPIMSGLTEFMIDTYDDGSGEGGVYYPSNEPLRTDGAGSHLTVKMDMTLYTEDDNLVLERKIVLNFDDEIAYWMRWGLDNIGSEDALFVTGSSLAFFQAGTVTEEDRGNRVIDDVEKSQFEIQMGGLATTYMDEGMALDLEELVGNSIQDIRISYKLD